MRSAVSLENTIIICLFAIATVAFLQCTAQNEILGQNTLKRSIDTGIDIFASLPRNKKLGQNYTIDSSSTDKTKLRQFLIGEDAPVWFASDNDGAGPKFKRYNISSVVGNAIKYYFLHKDRLSFASNALNWRAYAYNVRAKRIRYTERDPNVGCSKEKRCDSIPQTPAGDLKTIYITALVILDLTEMLPITSLNAADEVAKRITYIVAFWNMVNIKLNNLIKSTKVVIRIAGIILPEKPTSFARWTGKWTDFLQEMLDKMNPSFDEATWNNEFPPDSYDFIAFMTSTSVGGFDAYFPPGASSWQLPCSNDNNRIGNIMIWDNFMFTGVESAVQELMIVLGPTQFEHPRIPLLPRTSWAEKTNIRPANCAIRRIDDFLPYAWCLSTAKEYFPPGKGMKSILPGEVMSKSQYCSAQFYDGSESGTRLNPDCSHLECGKKDYVWQWKSMGRALDGTKCSSSGSMVCMDGQCVPNKWTRSY